MKDNRIIEVWITEKYLLSNDFFDFFQRPVDGMSAIQT
jgi:hypothetical protein